MPTVDERLCNPVSTAELERRWAAVRARMREAGIDALVVQGANAFSGGGSYLRWFTGAVVATSYPQTAIFPAEGLMTLVHHGDFGGEFTLDGTNRAHPGVGRRLTAPAFPTVAFTAGCEAGIAARVIRSAGFRTVGTVGAMMMQHGFAGRLKESLAELTWVDATDMVDAIKAVKSEEDIAAIRRTAAMQDEILARVGEHIRPGMYDFEVMAYAQYVGQGLGSETGYFLGSSAPPGEPALLRPRPQQGRQIRTGDVFLFQAENSGPGGFYVHLARFLVLGKAPQELVDAFGAMVEAQQYTLGLLKPGAACREVFQAYNAYMRSRGLPEERRLHCHGQGYEPVERPLVRDDETMAIGANLNIGIHPSVANERMFVTVCDNFLVGEGGVERLHRTPQEIMEL
ncbi:MAG: hypothetical protein A3G27_19675 [Betaproteobacteria bacterium RIFCSPLOWO2_12_FULL_66_14]|nr:MAG: hypothetical protein A3G27_19675 [Betaproteobacteria bacterium RIFCSPLOWO2_12_FULL_66_14]